MLFKALNNKEEEKTEHSYIYSHITKHLNFTVKSKRSQSALEYMMTYGWAILIIVIVAVILYSMGIFNPSSSITTTSIGFSPFTVSSTVCSPAGLSVAIIGGGLPDTATQTTITKIYITSNTGTTALTKAYTLNPVTISPGKTATIVIPTVACTSANVKYSLSAKLQYSYSTPAGGVVTNTTGTIAGTSSSNPIVKYVPLTITSSAATPAPFQQMVIVNMNNYNSYASSNLSNIEFTYPNGTIIPSWRENGTSNSQTVLYWLKLGSFTTTTVYMDFFSTSSNVLNTVNTGEAPQLSSTYAEYDDGTNVFNYYTNFAGTSLPSKWTTSDTAGISINNGVQINAGSVYTTSPVFTSTNSVEEMYTKYTALNSAGYSGIMQANTQSPQGGNSGSNAEILWMTNAGSNEYSAWSANGASASYNIQDEVPLGFSLSLNQFYVIGTFVSNTLVGEQINSDILTASGTFDTSQYIILGDFSGSGSGTSYINPLFVQWVRVRAYPPNGVMPTVSFGSLA
jgi:hypothetical protein